MAKVENSFTKFKDFLKKIRETIKADLDQNKVALWTLHKTLIQNNIESFQPNHELFSSLFETFNIKVTGNILKDLVLLEQKIRYNIAYDNEVIKTINNYIAIFDNEKAITYCENLFNILYISILAINNEMMDFSDAIRVFNSATAFNKDNLKKGKDDKETQEIIAALGSFFNRDGSFKKAGEPSELEKIANEFILKNKDYEETQIIFLQIGPQLSIYPFLFIQNMVEMYYQFLKEQAIIPNPKSEPVKKNERHLEIEEISKYYKGGKLIQIPEDIEWFEQLLNKSSLGENEIRHILKMVKKAKEDINKYPFLNDLEKSILEDAKEKLSFLAPYNHNYAELKQAIEDVDSLSSLYANITNETELLEFNDLREELISGLKIILDRLIEKAKTTDNNLIFLLADNESYFAKDVANIDKGIRKQAINILKRINIDNASNFKIVKADGFKDGELFEVYNGKIHVIFKELVPGIYLVLGASIVGKDYKTITNRLKLSQNQEFMQACIEELNDPERKIKLLANQIAPSDEDIKRTRKNNKKLDN